MVGYHVEGYQYPTLYSEVVYGVTSFGSFVFCVVILRGAFSNPSFAELGLSWVFLISGFSSLIMVFEPLEQARYEEIIDNASKCLNNEKEYC